MMDGFSGKLGDMASAFSGSGNMDIKSFLTDDMIAKVTNLKTVQEFIDKSPVPIDLQTGLQSLREGKYDEYIQSISDMKSGDEFVQKIMSMMTK